MTPIHISFSQPSQPYYPFTIFESGPLEWDGDADSLPDVIYDFVNQYPLNINFHHFFDDSDFNGIIRWEIQDHGHNDLGNAKFANPGDEIIVGLDWHADFSCNIGSEAIQSLIGITHDVDSWPSATLHILQEDS